ncbi:MAG: PEP/pyruvate-binding domain-containing protein, partial [Candidatus Margulisiibacteriota bacterium]
SGVRVVTKSYGEYNFMPVARGICASKSDKIIVAGPPVIGGKGGGTALLDAQLSTLPGSRFCIPQSVVLGSGFFPFLPREIQPEIAPLEEKSLTPARISQLFDILKWRLNGPLAIRSSAQVEDLGGSVAAGIFETEFDSGVLVTLEDKKRFIDKLLIVLNSAFARRAHPYWERQGYSRIPQIPVLIQEVVGRQWEFFPGCFCPEMAGIINTSSRSASMVATVLGLGVAAVSNSGSGLLHKLPKSGADRRIDLRHISVEGELNTSGIYAVNMKTGNIEYMTGPRATALFPHIYVDKLQQRFPNLQLQLAEFAGFLEEVSTPRRPYDIEFAVNNSHVVITQARPVQERRSLMKPKDNILFETQDLIGYVDSKKFNSIIKIKANAVPSSETIKYLMKKYPNSLIILDIYVLYTITSREVEEQVLPYTNSVLVIDSNAAGHKAGTGIQHFNLNLANEQKALLYSDNDKFIEGVRKKADAVEEVSLSFSGAEITVYRFNQPILVAADDVAGWAVVYTYR